MAELTESIDNYLDLPSEETYEELDHAFDRHMLRSLTKWQIDGISALPLHQSALTVLLLWGFSRSEIAQVLKIKPQSVKGTAMKARRGILQYRKSLLYDRATA